MKRMISSVVTAALIVSSTSIAAQSSSNAAISPSRGGRTASYWMQYVGKLPIGSTVRVRTSDGKRTTAVLAIVDDTGITLEQKTRIPEAPRRVPYDQLDQVELKQNGSSVGKAVAIGVAVGVGTFLGILALLAASWD
jgi:hypothetical protein